MMACIFCRIVKGMSSQPSSIILNWLTSADDDLSGEIPSFKLFESDKVFAFMDIQPLSRGHAVRGSCPCHL